MASVFFDPAVGGDASSVSDDSSPTTGLDNGGHRTRFVPALAQIVAIAQNVVAKAAAAAASAASALNAPGTNATSTSSLTIGTGAISLTLAQTGKAFSVGQTALLARTSAPATTAMWGIITAFNSGTGAMTVQVPTGQTLGSGTFTDWTVSLTASGTGVGTNRQVATSGLATGGGDLTADRTINVPAAAASDILAGIDATKALTSAALKTSQAVLALTDAATVNWNMASGVNAKVVLGGNRNLATPTNPTQGYTYALEVVQDATGGRVPTLPSAFKFGVSGAPSFSTGANKRDILFLYCYDASTPEFRASFSRDA